MTPHQTSPELATRPEPAAGTDPAPRRFLSMTLINFWLDATLLVSLSTVMGVSVMLQVVFPAPTVADGWTLWGLSYNQWHNVQFIALCVCAALALEHLVLHWNWVCTIVATKILRAKRPDDASQAVFGVGTLVTILLAVMTLLVSALLCVQAPTP